ncbi:Chalcone isomerase [Zostera marina]|uniref:Chalcone-flavonone isomerase family protein n=1 Tax=Zostera marina TaxID=29655 RepID=A0A0K9PSP5_ZOSMR|nr:Chalcone isomerase [Zostera marina]
MKYLDQWRGKTKKELSGYELFYEAIVACSLEKALKVVVIKEIEGSQYGVQLQNSVRGRLVEVDWYEEEELDKLTDFFQSKYMKKDSVIPFSFHGPTKTAKVIYI